MSQPPIADYAVIGDTRTAALCSREGSIDWLCAPRFDSEPIFGRLVGGDEGASFSISVANRRDTRRRYLDGSAILETTWHTGSAEVRLTEGMVLDVSGQLLPRLLLVRRVEARHGAATIRVRFDPRRGLPGTEPRSERRQGSLVCTWGPIAASVRTAPDLGLAWGREATLELPPGGTLTLVLALADREPLVFLPPGRAWSLLESTDRWWKGWTESIRYQGPMPGAVIRSLITLRLLTYTPSGAPVAAPTTSLPEEVGGVRNWDYRFAWPRDAAIGVGAFLSLGHPDEAVSFLYWLVHTTRLTRPRLGGLYRLDGRIPPEEREVPGVPGYRDSRPVRVGNAAAAQHQLDVYGWVLDAAWTLERSGKPLPSASWRTLSSFADFVCQHWREPDEGIWEVRDEPRHYVHSKLMGWVALDRALRLARAHGARRIRIRRWAAERDALDGEIRTRGFDERKSSYVRSYGSNELDASLLLLPWTGFEDPRSPRVIGTVEAIGRELAAGDALVYRYPPGSDGLAGGEGAFLPCSFWMVDALARIGRGEQAAELFEDLCRRSTDVGLMAEEMDPSSGEQLGNFPLALTHASIVQSALALGGAPPPA